MLKSALADKRPRLTLVIPGTVLVFISVSEQLISIAANTHSLWTRFQLGPLGDVVTSGWARLAYMGAGLVLIWLSTRRRDLTATSKSDIEFIKRFWIDGLQRAHVTSGSLLESVLQDYELAHPPAGHLVRWLYWELQNERYTRALQLVDTGERSSNLDMMCDGSAQLYLVLLEFDLWLRQLIPTDLEDYNRARHHQYAPFKAAMQSISSQLSYDVKKRPSLHRLSILMSEAKDAAKGPTNYPG